MATLPLSLRTVTESAQKLESSFKEKYDTEGAKTTAENLYRDGRELVKFMVLNKPPFSEIVSPVVVHLNQVVPSEDLQHNPELHNILSKTYRVFIELTWYQCWTQGNQSILKKTVDTIQANLELVFSSVAKNMSKHQVLIEFEYECAKQASACLKPSESIWNKYLGHTFKIIDAGIGKQIGTILMTLKDFLVDARKDWIASWYPEVWELRWLATKIETDKDLNTVIPQKVISDFQHKGREYTLCLATIWMDIIKNGQVDRNARVRAVQELCSLMTLEDQSRLERLLQTLSSGVKGVEKVALYVDRYWKTHILTLQFLIEIIHNNNYKELNSDSIKSIVTRAHTTRHIKEKEAISTEIEKLKQQSEKNKEYIDQLQTYLETISVGPTKGSNEEVETQAKLEKSLQEEQQITEQLQVLPEIQKTFVQMDQDENNYLKKLLEASKEGV